MNKWYLIAFTFIIAVAASCSRSQKPGALRSYSLNSLDGVIPNDLISFDKGISFDGQGSIKASVHGPTTIPLISVTDLKIDDTRLVYTARVRTEKVIGQVFLEMIAYFPYGREVLTRGQEKLLSGTNDWKDQEAALDLHKGSIPDSLRLSFVINGRGTAWIDDIALSRARLRRSGAQ